jgi:hypothetical protein
MTEHSVPSGIPEPWQRTVLRAPRDAGGVLSRPVPEAVPSLLRESAQRLSAVARDVSIGGRTLDQLRRDARREVIELARRYTRDVSGDEPDRTEPNSSGPLVVTGHQPVWFHPGVWAKNFATAAIARAHGGTPLNLIVDHDTRNTTSVWVPRGTRRQPARETVTYDTFQGARPWEDVGRVVDAPMFASFAGSLVERMRDWGIEPLVAQVWPEVTGRVGRGERLVDAFVAARAQTERHWQAGTLELPTSRLAETEAFRWFAADLLADLPTLHASYNRTVRRYRQVNKVRNVRHPVPELGAKDGGWLEAPLWVWKAGDTQRGRLFARREGGRILLADERGSLPELMLPETGDLCCAVRDLAAWPALGLRLRPRALTMTMFARVFLADLFVHGIGGAKYDEVTDRLIVDLYGIAPPGFLTVTSTEHLPLGMWEQATENRALAASRLREIAFSPERFLGEASTDPRVTEWLAEKRRLCVEQAEVVRARRSAVVPTQLERQSRRDRFRRLRELNTALGEFVNGTRSRVESELAEFGQQARANKVLANREYPWLLFPEVRLRAAMTRIGESYAFPS